MDKSQIQSTNDNYRFLPPRESQFSAVANGIGNGVMVGIMPIAAWELYTKFKDKTSSRTALYTTVFATVSGCLLGAMYGRYEAKKIDHYRKNVSDELLRLRSEVEATKQSPASWSAKEDQRATAAPASEVAL